MPEPYANQCEEVGGSERAPPESGEGEPHFADGLSDQSTISSEAVDSACADVGSTPGRGRRSGRSSPQGSSARRHRNSSRYEESSGRCKDSGPTLDVEDPRASRHRPETRGERPRHSDNRRRRRHNEEYSRHRTPREDRHRGEYVDEVPTPSGVESVESYEATLSVASASYSFEESTFSDGDRRTLAQVPDIFRIHELRNDLSDRVDDLKHKLTALTNEIAGLRENADVITENERARMSEVLASNTKNLEDMFRSNERSSSSLEVMNVIMSGTLAFDLLDRLVGEWSVIDTWWGKECVPPAPLSRAEARDGGTHRFGLAARYSSAQTRFD